MGTPLKMADEDVARLAARGDAGTARLSDFLVRDTPVAYAFIAPAFFLLLFLVAYPFVLSLWFSLSDARVGETGNFIGLDNFARLLRSGIFLQTLQNSIVFTACSPCVPPAVAIRSPRSSRSTARPAGVSVPRSPPDPFTHTSSTGSPVTGSVSVPFAEVLPPA